MAVYRHMEVDIPKERVTIEKQSNGKPALVKYVLAAPYDRERDTRARREQRLAINVLAALQKCIQLHNMRRYSQAFWKNSLMNM